MAASGVLSETKRIASAVVATGPSTVAPCASRSIFKPVLTCQESSTTSTRSPARSKGLRAGDGSRLFWIAGIFPIHWRKPDTGLNLRIIGSGALLVDLLERPFRLTTFRYFYQSSPC